jgi:hypothetical protein
MKRSPLHDVVDFSGVWIAVKAVQNLALSFFSTQEKWAIFDAVVDFTAMEHAIWRFECVKASATTSTTIWCSAYLAALHESLIEVSWISFSRRCSKVLLLVFWWRTTIRINTAY